MQTAKRFVIRGIGISAVNMDSAISVIGDHIRNGKYGYICVANEKTTSLASVTEDYGKIQNSSIMTLPDGMPLVWLGRNLGHKEVARVAGFDLLKTVLKISTSKGYSHYFYGSTPETIEIIRNKLQNEYPEVAVAGLVSPPFQPVEAFNIDAIAEEINRLKPTFFWCGLGAPKQERVIARLQPKLDATICIGVGLAFEYMAGRVKRLPEWAQRIGLEGFYRLYQQPQRIDLAMFGRYMYWLGLLLYTKIFKRT